MNSATPAKANINTPAGWRFCVLYQGAACAIRPITATTRFPWVWSGGGERTRLAVLPWSLSAFGGLPANTPWYNTTLGIAMLLGRFGYVVPVLAMAIYQKVGSFQREQFVEAARAHGLSHGRILGFHILWANCTPVLARHYGSGRRS